MKRNREKPGCGIPFLCGFILFCMSDGIVFPLSRKHPVWAVIVLLISLGISIGFTFIVYKAIEIELKRKINKKYNR